MFRSDYESHITHGPQADDSHAEVRAWFSGVAGSSLLAAEASVLREQLADRFGYHLVQVGAVPGLDVLDSSRILQRCVVDLDGRGGAEGYPFVRGRAAGLPMDSDSVDVVLLPHVLEFEPHAHEALREAARILVPEGHLFICTLNPYSLMGLGRAWPRRVARAPWTGQFLSQGRIRDWLKLVGLELSVVRGVFFRPPLGNARVMSRLAPMESLGRHLWPALAGAFVIGTRKRVSRATPLRPRLALRPRLVGASLAGSPPARVKNEE